MITVDATSPIPPFEQLRAQLVDQIRSGQLAAGHRLPSIRQLAGDLRVAPGTVARAYSALEAAGLVETSRAAGTRVCAGQSGDGVVRREAERFVAGLRDRDVTLGEVLGAVRAAWDRSASRSA